MPKSPSRFTFLIAGFCRALPSWKSRAAFRSQIPENCFSQSIPLSCSITADQYGQDAMSWKQDVLFNQVFGLFYWPPPHIKLLCLQNFYTPLVLFQLTKIVRIKTHAHASSLMVSDFVHHIEQLWILDSPLLFAWFWVNHYLYWCLPSVQ